MIYLCLHLDKTKVIHDLLKSKWLDTACRNIGGDLWEDLRQEFLLIILEKPDTAFADIRDLRFWTVGILVKMFHPIRASNGSLYDKPFIKKHRPMMNSTQLIEDIPDQSSEYEHEIDHAITQKDGILSKLPFYEKRLYQLVEKGFSCRRISEVTGINRNEVNRAVSIVKKLIKENCTTFAQP